MKLTRGGQGMVALIVFVGALSALHSATVFIALSCLIAALALNAPYARLAVRNLTIVRTHPSHVQQGARVTVRLQVRNGSPRARILLRLFDAGPRDAAVAPVQIPMLAGGATRHASYTCVARRRGVHRFSRCRVESSSPFGLVNGSREVTAVSELVVYPRYEDLSGAALPFRTTYSGMTGSPGSRPGEGASFFGLREYRPGDSIRKIHWPTTVRAQTTMVKEFDEDMHSAVTILLDTNRRAISRVGDDDNLEAAIRVAASLANHTLQQGHPTTLVSIDPATGRVRSDASMGDLTPILDALARIEPTEADTMELLTVGRAAAQRQSNWIVVLLAAEREAIEEVLRLRSFGGEIILVIVDDHGRAVRGSKYHWFPAMVDAVGHSGVTVVLTTPGDDIQDTLARDLRPPNRVAG